MEKKIAKTTPKYSLKENHAAIYLLDMREIPLGLYEEYEKILSPEEKKIKNSFYFHKDRTRFLSTRAMIRTLLGEYHGLKPEDLIFEKNRYGKPFLKRVFQERPLGFNLSHSGDLVAAIVMQNPKIGIDIEQIVNERGNETTAPFFSPQEQARLSEISDLTEKKQLFFDYWTIKEAYTKAIGKGLSIPFDSFYFEQTLSGIHPVHISGYICEPHWHFRHVINPGPYKIALAIGTDSPRDPMFDLYKYVPLSHTQKLEWPIVPVSL